MAISIINRKVLFLGYGAVAKCVWNYFSDFFVFHRKRVVLVDKTKTAFYGPNLKNVRKIVREVNATNFTELLDALGMKQADIVIDLTTATPTYFFIKQCYLRGLHYINTSIEDEQDQMLGTSIDCQQHMVKNMMTQLASEHPPRSTIVTECGQNPGLIQHYVLHALNELRKQKEQTDGIGSVVNNDFRMETLRRVIRDHHVGTILMSEVDHIRMKKGTVIDPLLMYNTWSVNGFFFEALDKVELVRGKANHFIQPLVKDSILSSVTMKIYQPKEDYDVLFLSKNALRCSLNSICPVINPTNPNGLSLSNYRGKLIHHGEIFELARKFGEDTPFMSYVYQSSPYVDESITRFYRNFPGATEEDLHVYVNQPDTFCVMDNIKMGEGNLHGSDSIGCTIFCGQDKIEHIYWCGTILSSTDTAVKPEFTPTIVQVAAGVLSGLSYALEHPAMGWCEPTDMDTMYILEKSIPLLGKFFFMEIPVSEFNGKLSLKVV